MPWDLLQLDRETATPRDVKKAYARLLKTTRPDQDPEGFRRLHDAYEFALNYSSSREAQPASAPVQPLADGLPANDAPAIEEPQPEPPPPPGVQAVMDTFEPLVAALRHEASGVADLVRATEQALYAHPEACESWSMAMATLIRDFPDNKELSLKPEAMLFELEHEQFHATFQVIHRLDRQGRVAGIGGLSEVLLDSGLKTHAAAVVAMRLAFADAVWNRRYSERLANFAYPHLSSSDRRNATMELERADSLGLVLREVPVEMKGFWRDRLLQVDPDYRWEDAQAKEALALLKSPTGRRWPAYKILVDHLPPEIRDKMPAEYKKREENWDRPSPAQQQRRVKVHHQPSSRYSGGGGSGIPPLLIIRIAGAGVVLLLTLLKACVASGNFH